MEQHEIYKGLEKDLLQECLSCKVPGGCSTGDDRCGRRRGIKYGLYPDKCIKNSRLSVEVPIEVHKQIQFGFGSKEEPLFSNRDNMMQLVDAVAKYNEPWMQFERWDLA